MNRTLFSVVTFCVSSLFAHADTMFNVRGTLNSGYVISGTLTLNTSSTAFSAIDLLLITPNGGTNVFDTIRAEYVPANSLSTELAYVVSRGSTDLLDLYLPVSSLTGKDGGNICYHFLPCSTPEGYVQSTIDGADLVNFVDGTITPASSVTPEPSTFALFGTGLFGFAGVIRKRAA